MSEHVRHVQGKVDPETFRQLKVELARRGITLNDMIQDAVQSFLAKGGDHGERLALDR